MKRAQKIILFVLLAFTVRLIISCCDCNYPVEAFDLKQVEIYPIDNTGAYPQPANDTLYRKAIAFEIQVGDNQLQEFAIKKNSLSTFNELKACECVMSYKLNYSIDSITIITNRELSFIYPAKSDLSDKFYASKINWGNPGSLYQTLDELVEDINTYSLSDSRMYRFLVVLDKIYTNSDIVSFTFTFHMSNGEKIIGLSPDIYLTD